LVLPSALRLLIQLVPDPLIHPALRQFIARFVACFIGHRTLYFGLFLVLSLFLKRVRHLEQRPRTAPVLPGVYLNPVFSDRLYDSLGGYHRCLQILLQNIATWAPVLRIERDHNRRAPALPLHVLGGAQERILVQQDTKDTRLPGFSSVVHPHPGNACQYVGVSRFADRPGDFGRPYCTMVGSG